MSKTYRIKPLVWEVIPSGNRVARTIVGRLIVREWTEGITTFDGPGDVYEEREFVYEAIAAAEAWYVEKLMQALEEV